MHISNKNICTGLCTAPNFAGRKKWHRLPLAGSKRGLTPAPSDRPGPVNFPLPEKGKLNQRPTVPPLRLCLTRYTLYGYVHENRQIAQQNMSIFVYNPILQNLSMFVYNISVDTTGANTTGNGLTPTRGEHHQPRPGPATTPPGARLTL